MIALTAIVSLLVAICAIVMRPTLALGAIIASALLWPEYLRIPAGIQFSAPRIGAMVLLVRLLGSQRHRVGFGGTDILVLVYYLWLVGSALATSSPVTTTVIGSGLDTALMYFVARRAFAVPSEAKDLIAPLAITAGAMVLAGLSEAIARNSPYVPLLQYSPGYNEAGGGSEVRLGMRRAFGPTQQPIYFGMAMMMITGLIFALRGLFKARWQFHLAFASAFVATLTSLSSGPWAALILTGAMNALFFARWLIKPAIWGALLLMIFFEAFSSRHFYHLIDYLSLDQGTAWYRSRLIEVGFMHLHEYWMFGYGGQSPSHWGREIDGRGMVDMVNNYLIVAYFGGVFAVVLYLAIKGLALASVVRAFKSGNPAVQKIAFSLGALMIATSASEFSVGLFATPLILYFMLLGCMVSVGGWPARIGAGGGHRTGYSAPARGVA